MDSKLSKYIFIGYSIIAIITMFALLITQKYTLVFSAIIIYMGYLLFIYVERTTKITVQPIIKLLVVLTLILHQTFGKYFTLYLTTTWFDNLLHVYGTFSFALFFYLVSKSLFNGNMLPKTFVFLYIFCLGITIGVFLEIAEFTMDELFNQKHQHSLLDTNLDLIFNVVGAFIASILRPFLIKE